MRPPWHYEDHDVQVNKLCVGPMENNAYVVACRRTGKSAIIDAASEPERLIAALEGTSPQAILTTHGHWDHVGAASIAATLGIPFLIGRDDLADSGVEDAAPLDDGPFTLGQLTIQVLPTPGHTSGSTCFAVHGIVFTGDTLFPGGPGATGGSPGRFRQILDSIETRLFALPDATLVMPGHGLDTTIGSERPHLDEWRTRGW